MPVPAPRIVRYSSHPVTKFQHPGDVKRAKGPLGTTTINQQDPPRASVPYGARESTAELMDPWTSQKPRRIWEDDSFGGRVDDCENNENMGFQSGLMSAGNALVTKGVRAQAPFPPLFPSVSFAAPTSYERYSEPLDDDASSDLSGMHYVNGSEWSYDEDDFEMADGFDQPLEGSYGPLPSAVVYEDDRLYGSPPLAEDFSPIEPMDPMSSPGPITPFADFVDRAVTSRSPTCGGYVHRDVAEVGQYQGKECGSQCQECMPGLDYGQECDTIPASVTPSANDAYRKLTGPISEWIATYVWKVCTTGMNLAAVYAPTHSRERKYAIMPPSDLATSIRSLLLSTLLQPSAIFLALKYITRLPVFVGPMLLGDEHLDAVNFRRTLLGPPDAYDRLDRENQAPYHVVVLGFMLANKWLDDHTFSNKTWHTISNIPLRLLNEVEMKALTVFRYDLSIHPEDWSLWLSHITSYHTSLASSQHPQPISRPSSSPYTVIRKAIEEVAEVSDVEACHDDCCSEDIPSPVFIGLEARQREKELAWEVETFDLDEDGPLPEQYQRKRRISRAESTRSCRSRDSNGARRPSVVIDQMDFGRSLPPPAKWSPQADELFVRNSERAAGHYAAPRTNASFAPRVAPLQPSYLPPSSQSRFQPWPTYVSDSFRASFQPSTYQLTRDPYGYPLATSSQGHGCSQSYASGAGYGNVRVSPPDATWHHADYPTYAAPSYYQPVWGRA